MKKTYYEMRRVATILRDEGGYSLAASQMNPVIFEEFVGVVLEEEGEPVIWEPFAGRVGRSWFLDFAEEIGIQLLSQTLNPIDSRIVAADSTVTGPDRDIGGVLFHPPYYASAPALDNPRDVVLNMHRANYLRSLGMVMDQAETRIAHGGLVCAIARDYRIHGERIHLDLWMLELFEKRGYCLEDVWSSEPDIVLILRSQK